MVIAVTLLVLALIGAVSALVAAAVTRRAAAQRVDAVIRTFDGDRPAHDERTQPTLDRALDELERVAVTERQRRQRVAEAENRLSWALGAIANGVVIFDERGEIAYRNDPAASFLAARHSDALVEEAITTMAADALRGRGAERELELFGPPRRVLSVRAVPLADEHRPSGVLVVVEDTSERRRLENVRRDFVANISHELKTPVGALALLAETLLDEDDPEVTRRLAERLASEAFRVGNTIDDLLELSRLEVATGLAADDVGVAHFVQDAADRVRPAAEQRGIEIDVDAAPVRLSVVGDRRQLVSAVTNLLDNAVKYSEPGSTVQVTSRTDGRWVDVTVRDHGIGIPRRDLERIFERFYRVDRARSRDTGGTGLGLAIVRHVASNHRGEIRVESREGRGIDVHAAAPGRPGSRRRHQGGRMTTPDATVLLVEDEDSFVEALTLGLKREGFRVQTAHDGAEALEIFDVVKPDLVLLDVMLPKVSGVDVCRELRRRSTVPIIMVTAKGSEIDTVVGLEVGADDYVTKPYRLRELVARMRAVLRRRPADTSSRSGAGDVLEVGDVRLDPERHEVEIRGQQVKLPLKEFELLELLLLNAGRVLPRDTLIDRVWGTDYVGDTKTLDVHVKRLRAKVEDDPAVPTRIVTIRGLGYKYDTPRAS